jgi:hypothetical protein
VPRSEPDDVSVRDRDVIRLCLKAAVEGPFFDDDEEFHTIFGLNRDDVRAILAAWPSEPTFAPGGYQSATDARFVAVNNAMNNLLGYPHGHHGEAFERRAGVSEAEVAATLRRWRQDATVDPTTKGYADPLM